MRARGGTQVVKIGAARQILQVAEITTPDKQSNVEQQPAVSWQKIVEFGVGEDHTRHNLDGEAMLSQVNVANRGQLGTALASVIMWTGGGRDR